MKLSVHDITERGLSNFNALSPIEKDVFVINDLDLYYEMEGGFEDYILGQHHPELTWLCSVLQRIGDQQSGQVITSLLAMSEHQREQMLPLCTQFYELRDKRYGLLSSYLKSKGIELNE